MMVTQIVPITKSRSRILIDDKPAFVLYKGELRLFGLEENSEIAWEVYHRIMNEVLPKRAILRAMNLLKSKDYTEEELRRKLKGAEYPDSIAENAIQYVTSYGYIDDLRYAEGYISDYENRKTRKRIEMDLLRKGVSRTVMECAWREWEAKGGAADEKAMMEALLKKRNYDPLNASLKEKQRTYAFLMRKGFSADLIMDLLKE